MKLDAVLGRRFLSSCPVTVAASVEPPIRPPHYLRKEVNHKILKPREIKP